MMGFGDMVAPAPPRQTVLGGRPHFLAYIQPDEAMLLRRQGGGVAPGGGQWIGPAGVPAFWSENGVSDSNDPGAGSGGSVGENTGGGGDSKAEAGEGAGGGGDAPITNPTTPTGPTPEEIAAEQERLRQEQLATDREAASGQLQTQFDGMFGDALYSGRRDAFMSRYQPRITADREAVRLQTMESIAPELRATPLARALSLGVDDAANSALSGLGSAWSTAEASMRDSAGKALAAALARVRVSENPWADVTGEGATLQGLAAQQGAAMPDYSYALAPPVQSYGSSLFANPENDERAQRARLDRLLASLPQMNASVVG